MCYGYDGEAALQESLERKGASRRGLLRGAVAGAAGATVLAGAPAMAGRHPGKGHGHGHGHGHTRHKEVPTDLISIQLYTLRSRMRNDAEIQLMLDQLAKFGYERVERAGLYSYTAAQFKEALDARGIWASSSHDGIAADAAGLNKKLDDANTFRQKYINVAYLNSPNKSDWQLWAEQMNTEAAAARKRGLRYGYHNHAHEFTTDLGGGLTPWEVLTERLDPRYVHLEVDLYWVYTGGVNSGATDPDRFAIDVIREAPQRVRQFHVKDRDGATGDMCDLGTGVVNFPRIFRTHTVEEYIVENDTPDVSPLTSAAVGHLYLDHLDY
jgi:sugar phosphate isomerase/epimerase